MGVQPGQIKDLIAQVSSHKGGTKNAFGISVEGFIENIAESKEKYILPFDPTALKFKNDEKAIDHYFTKYEDLAFKIAASPNNYI